jgi:hypothetical protein
MMVMLVTTLPYLGNPMLCNFPSDLTGARASIRNKTLTSSLIWTSDMMRYNDKITYCTKFVNTWLRHGYEHTLI